VSRVGPRQLAALPNALLEAGTPNDKATATATALADYFRDKPVSLRQLAALRNALVEVGATTDKADKAAEELADHCKSRDVSLFGALRRFLAAWEDSRKKRP